ncbi:MAG: hypothetical protein ACO1N0_16130 [Fluviicola sp.]
MKATLLYTPFLALLLFSCSDKEPKKDIPKQEVKAEIDEIYVPIEETTELAIHESKFRVLPVDESSKDKSLKQFVDKLKQIVQKKDLDGFIACLDTGIVVSWGGGMFGIPTFLEEWNLDKNPQKSPLWQKMKLILELGGAWGSEEDFRIPYMQSDRLFRETDGLDWYVTAVCVSPKTVVYKKPEGEKTALLSYEVVRIKNRLDNFLEIQTVDKKVSGFVKRDQIIESAEAFPVIEKVNGNWKITSFAGYD